MFNGKIHYKWSFSIAMLVYQRVCNVYCIPPIHDENYDLLWDLGVPEVQTNLSYRGN